MSGRGDDDQRLSKYAGQPSRRMLLGGAAAIAGGVIGHRVLAQQPGPAQLAQPPALSPPKRGPALAAPPQPIEVQARALSGFGRNAGAGGMPSRLEFVGGVVLTSPHPDFGGWSGLVTSEDGGRIFTVSDRGNWLFADLMADGQRPKGLANAVLGEIAGVGGQSLGRGRDRDSESVALLDGTLSRGTLLVAFERNHRIGRFPISDRGLGAPIAFLKLAPDARRMSANRGLEAVTVVRGGPLRGAVIAFAEEMHDTARNHTGWIWAAGPSSEPQRLGLVNIADFAITDAASLPDGSIIVLERKFRWLEGVKMRMRLIKAQDIRPGALLDGEVLIDADMTSEIDNMEGLAISRDARGQTVLTVISDNNFNSFLQRTLLLRFVLKPSPLEKAAGP